MSCGSLALSLSLISLNLLAEGTSCVVIHLLGLRFLIVFRGGPTSVIGRHLLLQELLHRLLMGLCGCIVGLVVRVHFGTTSGAVEGLSDVLSLLILVILVCWEHVDAITTSSLGRRGGVAFGATHSIGASDVLWLAVVSARRHVVDLADQAHLVVADLLLVVHAHVCAREHLASVPDLGHVAEVEGAVGGDVPFGDFGALPRLLHRFGIVVLQVHTRQARCQVEKHWTSECSTRGQMLACSS